MSAPACAVPRQVRLAGFNFNQFSGSYPTSERYGGYTSFTHKVCEDQLVLYGDAFYQNVKTHNELAPRGNKLVPDHWTGNARHSAKHAGCAGCGAA